MIRVQPLAPETEAVELFVDRATNHGDFVLDEHSRPLVERICVALDGLPLAVELAAARSSSMALEEIIEGLDERFVLFTHGRRTAHERHRSLRAMVEWSSRSLSGPLESVFVKASVFASPFSAAAVAAVTNMSEMAAMSAVGELVDRSLLVEHRSEGQRARYGFLQTIQAYASEVLAAAVHFLALFRMQAEMFSWIAETADVFGETDHRLTEDVLGSASVGKWLAGDLEGARRYAILAEQQAGNSEYPCAGRCATEAVADVLQFEGNDRESRACFERATLLSEEQDDPARIICNLADRNSLHFIKGVAGLTRAGLYVRDGNPMLAVPALVDLLEYWRRCGASMQQEITLRTVVDLLVRLDRLDAAAVILGALHSSERSAEVTGADAARLRSAQGVITARISEADSLVGRGAAMDLEAVAELSMRFLRDIEVTGPEPDSPTDSDPTAF
ncbi:MAG: hypothetical protein GY708_22050 [Actinomycetia bacterium]|nr:hypothetical protein [Actinomycetes bacterium]